MIWSKKYSALYTACLLAVTFEFTGCSENAPTDLRKYIPTDAIMVGYLDCERLLEHPDIIANHKLATDLGEYFHHLLRSIGFSNPKEHFANFYFLLARYSTNHFPTYKALIFCNILVTFLHICQFIQYAFFIL